MILFYTTAFALDCTGLDPQVCDDANTLAAMAEAAWGSPVVTDTSSNARLRTRTVYDNLLVLRAAIEPDCTVDGLAAGRYRTRSTLDGTWTTPPSASGTFTGTLHTGSLEGTQSDGTPIGDRFGVFEGERFVANRDADGFGAGHFAKVSGLRGITYAYTGTCTTNAARTLDPWYPGSLVAFHSLRIFNSRPWTNPMTGIAAMDAKCQADWDELGDGPGTYLAAVTDTANGILYPAQRFPLDQEVVLMGTEEWVADDVASFFDPTLFAGQVIDVEADGSTFAWVRNTQQSLTWWGDYPSDDPYSLGGNDCDGWTNPASPTVILGGEPNTNHVRVYGWSLDCEFLPLISSRTYCIEGF